MAIDLSELQRRFDLSTIVRFEAGKGGLVRAVVRGALGSAEVYLHGAHVTGYQPVDARPVLWVSEKSVYQPDKPIRGGVPICFPWFGPRAGEPSSPIHGFARIMEWSVQGVSQSADGVVELVFSLASDDQTRKIWPHEFSVTYRVRVGATLELALRVTNHGPGAFAFEEALHTYLATGDVRQVKVTGLEGTSYIDKTDGLKQKPQGSDPVTISAETDRVYLNTRSACVLHDPVFQRKITIDKSGSDTTVVWNPWVDKSKAMADFGDDEWIGMICVETCNAGDQRVTLQPGASHEMKALIGAGS